MALIALVLGIGLNMGVFTAINSLATRPWDVPEPDRVVNAYSSAPKVFPGLGGFPVAAARFLDAQSRTAEGVLASVQRRVQLDDGGAQADVDAAFVSGNYFDVLRAPLAAGRAFLPEEDVVGAPIAVAVLGHFAWTQRFGA